MGQQVNAEPVDAPASDFDRWVNDRLADAPVVNEETAPKIARLLYGGDSE